MSEILHIREEDLELYAFGTLAEEETPGVTAHVSECRECSSKLAVVLGDVAVLALAAARETAEPQGKERLFARVYARC